MEIKTKKRIHFHLIRYVDLSTGSLFIDLSSVHEIKMAHLMHFMIDEVLVGSFAFFAFLTAPINFNNNGESGHFH